MLPDLEEKPVITPKEAVNVNVKSFTISSPPKILPEMMNLSPVKYPVPPEIRPPVGILYSVKLAPLYVDTLNNAPEPVTTIPLTFSFVLASNTEFDLDDGTPCKFVIVSMPLTEFTVATLNVKSSLGETPPNSVPSILITLPTL